MMKFEELALHTDLLRAIADRGYREMTEVQEKTLPVTILKKDVAVQSQTGSGKTAAFLITLFQRLLTESDSRKPRALIIVPTRELAVQIGKEALLLNRRLDFSIGRFYGGVGYTRQLAQLKDGLDISIGTPGRLLDLSQRGNLNLKRINILVIDEADRLFDMGFLPDLHNLLRRMPDRHSRQTMLFSATLNRVSDEIAGRYMNQPVTIEIQPEQMTVETISQTVFPVPMHLKLNLLLGILQEQDPKNALIFTNTRHVAEKLSKRLNYNGLRSRHLTGDLPQRKRLRIMDEFKAGKFPLLVATDVAARGLDIENLEVVVNYDIPQDIEVYVHRIGRTARAGKSGKALTLATEGTGHQIKAIESYIGMKLNVYEAEDELYAIDSSVEMQQADRKSMKHQRPRRDRSGPRQHRKKSRR